MSEDKRRARMNALNSGRQQQTLFDLPDQQPALSQWFTPPWIARRLAQWAAAKRAKRILEPSCGSGALIQALIDQLIKPTRIVGVELDAAWHAHCARTFANTRIVHADFLTWLPPLGVDLTVMNPPFEQDLHVQFVRRALLFCPVIIGIFPQSMEFGVARDADLWSRAYVTRRARLPQRVKYGGEFSASFDSVALEIHKRDSARQPREICTVQEEIWREHE